MPWGWLRSPACWKSTMLLEETFSQTEGAREEVEVGGRLWVLIIEDLQV